MSRLLIVEDLPEARAWLAEIAGCAFPEAVIATAPTLAEALAAADEGNWDMALVDLGLPDGSGLDVIRRLARTAPQALCVITTVLGDDAHIVAALSAGAQGYLLKGQPREQIHRQLVQLRHGIPALSPTIARRIMEHFQRTGPVAEPSGELTPRETEVLALIARGLRNADVAIALGLAETTIATHIKAIYRKLGISSRAEASRHASRLGLS
ncbi:response regulator transcription factor [Arsenicitalea aurantiaca]|uniref:Response regulator transcription factor n=1 Tax=Arsenicitalea aurantiaca TaxID=1783274 RepID=A0A433XMN3_9HYPH|nr:response regulator transcription factor [Arsenicitalea aurantiaca]